MEQANDALQTGQEPKTFSVKVWTDANWEPMMQTVTEDELVNGYLRQSDYTKKTQEIAEERKMLDAKANQAQDQWFKGDPSDDEAVESYLQSKGYTKADQLEKLIDERLQWITKKQQDDQTISGLITSNPDLKQFEWAIRKLATLEPTKAIEDIVAENGFSTHDKLSKAKQRDIRGGSTPVESGTKSINDMTPAEWETYKAKNQKVSAFG